MALALCMEEYLRSVSKTSVDIPNRDTLVREYNTLVDAGLGSSKNARLLQAKISEYNQIALDAMRAKNLFNFVKRAREVFGESTLLVGSKQFDEVCKKYKLVKGLLKQYTGVTKKAVDPIVYQPCAYGVLIHSMWGEESEDKVFEEYKRINNLML